MDIHHWNGLSHGDGQLQAQSAALAREVTELREAVGEQFQGYLRSWVGHMRDLVGYLKDNSDWLVKFGEAVMVVAGAIATYGIVTKIQAMIGALSGLASVVAANPIALLVTGIVASGVVVYKSYNDIMDQIHARGEQIVNDARRNALISGKVRLGDLRKQGMTDDQIREMVTGKKLEPGESWNLGTGINIKIGKPGPHEPTDEDIRRTAEERRRRGEAE